MNIIFIILSISSFCHSAQIYTKYHPGTFRSRKKDQNERRHLCPHEKEISIPVKSKKSYCKPVFKSYTYKCHNNNTCQGVRLIYETEYKDTYEMQNTKKTVYSCCPGWTKPHNSNHGCMKPICTLNCENGGKCSAPETCTCPPGFSGKQCEQDIDECAEKKPCDHNCYNTDGSYYCKCKPNFQLQADKESCVKDYDSDDFNKTELSDELDVLDRDYEALNLRIKKLEEMMGTDEENEANFRSVQELQYKLQDAITTISMLEKKVHHLTDAIKYMNNENVYQYPRKY